MSNRKLRQATFLRRGKMGRRKVVEIQCDRCGKTEVQTESEVQPEGAREIICKFKGEEVSFADLCRRCRTTVENIFKRLKRDVEEAPEVVTKLPTGSGAHLSQAAKVK